MVSCRALASARYFKYTLTRILRADIGKFLLVVRVNICYADKPDLGNIAPNVSYQSYSVERVACQAFLFVALSKHVIGFCVGYAFGFELG